jgi:hypothetical protein
VVEVAECVVYSKIGHEKVAHPYAEADGWVAA